MKKLILIAACLFTISIADNAQEVPAKANTGNGERQKGAKKLTAEQRAQKNVTDINAEVTLTEDQKSKIHTLALTRITKVEEIKAKYKDQPENQEISKNEMDAVKKEFRQNVKAILSAEQLEKLKSKHKEMKAAGKVNALEAKTAED